jgi:hypothetical protein
MPLESLVELLLRWLLQYLSLLSFSFASHNDTSYNSLSIRPRIDSFMRSFVRLLTHSITHSITQSLTHPLLSTHVLTRCRAFLGKECPSLVRRPLHCYLDASSNCTCIYQACADYHDLDVYHSSSATTIACLFTTRHRSLNL